MQVFINARFLSQSVTGVQRFAAELLLALDNLIDSKKIDNQKLSFALVAPNNLRHKLNLKHIPLLCFGKLNGHLWEQFELPFYTRNGLLVNLCNTFPLFKFNQLLVIHDASVFSHPQTYSLAFRLWYKLLLHFSRVVVRRIITVSCFSKEELVRYCKISHEKLRVIYEGKEHITKLNPDYSILKKYNLYKNSFVLAVSSNKHNKNFASFIYALNYLNSTNIKAVIAGGTNHKIYSRLPSFSSNNATDVKTLGYVSDEELKALYENAACFVYPSLYEGFGLPPLEAIACGCPLVVSNTASLPEVCGDAALYCDPYSPEDIAQKIQQLLSDDTLRNDLRQKGLERAKQFTWDKCASEMFEIIEKFLH